MHKKIITDLNSSLDLSDHPSSVEGIDYVYEPWGSAENKKKLFYFDRSAVAEDLIDDDAEIEIYEPVAKKYKRNYEIESKHFK